MDEGVCPVCNGTGRNEVGDKPYKELFTGYDKETNTLPCHNCGGQTMYGKPSGKVPLRPDGTPCIHSYGSKTVGRCLTEYKCVHCGHTYTIDSGD